MGLRLEYRPAADLEKNNLDIVQKVDCADGCFHFSENLHVTREEAVTVAREHVFAPLNLRVWALRITFKKEY